MNTYNPGETFLTPFCPICSCGGWVDNGCGPANGCAVGVMNQIRSCSPGGCMAESQCISGPICSDPWWNTNYMFRQRINMTGTSGGMSANYAVKMAFDHSSLVSAGKSQSDGDDVRIVYYNGATNTELSRAIADSSSWNSGSSTLMFKLETAIGANSYDDGYYLYYDRPSATNPPTNTLSYRYKYTEDLSVTSTSSSTYSTKETLTFTPSDTSEHWIVMATWEVRDPGSGTTTSYLGRSRLTINGATRTGTDNIGYRQRDGQWKSMVAFFKITGTTSTRTIDLDFRANGGTDEIDDVRMLAFLLPDPANADLQYDEDLPTTIDTVRPTNALRTTFSPSSSGDYVYMTSGFHREGPGGAGGGLYTESESSSDISQSSESYIGTTQTDYVPHFALDQRTLSTTSKTFDMRHMPDATSGSERRGLTMLLFRSDVFDTVQEASSTGFSTTTSTSFQTKTSMTTASTSNIRDSIYIVTSNLNQASSDHEAEGQIRFESVEQVRDEKKVARSGYQHSFTWVYAEAGTGGRNIDIRYRRGAVGTAEIEFAHIIALRYKDPVVTFSSEESQ